MVVDVVVVEAWFKLLLAAMVSLLFKAWVGGSGVAELVDDVLVIVVGGGGDDDMDEIDGDFWLWANEPENVSLVLPVPLSLLLVVVVFEDA